MKILDIPTVAIMAIFLCKAQTAGPGFEVASVRPHRNGGGTTRHMEQGSLTYVNITLGEFIEMAYGVKHYQISGPAWVVSYASSDRYDIVAKAGRLVRGEELQRMLAPLLVDRFHLALHRETRELSVYALVVAKNGPKFKQGDGGAESVSANDGGGYTHHNWSMATFANSLSLMSAVQRLVVDRTGLQGGYTFRANLRNPPKGISPSDLNVPAADCEDVFCAVQEQLGLRLESRKEPVEVLVVDSAEKMPTEN
jgi:uncharacterized protein (TIGR03435 family)